MSSTFGRLFRATSFGESHVDTRKHDTWRDSFRETFVITSTDGYLPKQYRYLSLRSRISAE